VAQIAAAAAYFLTRLNPQVALCEAVAGRVRPVALAAWLRTVRQRLVEKARYVGAHQRVAVRLVAVRVPEAIVNERRRKARAQAQKRGYTPSQTYLALLAWNLFVTTVPGSVLSFLKRVRYRQAVADSWLQRLFASAAELRAFLQQVCLKAARLVAKACRKRRTSAQRLRESVQAQTDCIKLTIKLAA